MAAANENHAETAPEGEIEITRVLDAPCARVWKAWSNAETLQRWWGPRIFACPYCRIDFRAGGTYHHCMRSPDGQEYWSTGTYREIIPMRRIVATDSFADEKGGIISAAQIGMDGEWPLELLISIEFEDLGERTRFTLRHEGVPAGQMREMCCQGWNESFDRMAEVLQGK